MSLDVIRPKDIPRGKVYYVKDEDRSLKTDDIPTCQPTYPHLNYLQKPDLSVGCTDPEHAGSHARSYYAPMDRRVRDLSLTTADIEYAQPKVNKWKGNRHTDPVCPNYQLPSSMQRAQTPPRFNGRHTNDIADIELACPKKLHPDRNYVRNPNECRDIEFAAPNYQERMLRGSGPRDPRMDRSLNVKDISEPKRIRPRDTNPLDPVYKVPTNPVTSLNTKFHEEHNLGVSLAPQEAAEVGPVHGSKPRKLQWDNGEPQLSLLREDIAGTVPQRFVGAVPHNIYDPPDVRPMISFHDPHDIPGAQVGTLKKGIVTGRACNPLNPRYPMLDGDSFYQSVPAFEAERGSARHPHPMMQSRASGSASLPDLNAGGRTMRRDMSEAVMRNQTQMPDGYRPSRGPSGRNTPTQGHPMQQDMMPSTQRMPSPMMQSMMGSPEPMPM